MTPQNVSKLIDHLFLEEGLRLKPYKCTAGKTTIGIGRNLDDVGISEDEARYMLRNDIVRVRESLDKNCSWWASLHEDAQLALASMCFQLGWPRLSRFKKMLAALKGSQYELAAGEALDSAWAKQTPKRAERVARLIRGV